MGFCLLWLKVIWRKSLNLFPRAGRFFLAEVWPFHLAAAHGQQRGKSLRQLEVTFLMVWSSRYLVSSSWIWQCGMQTCRLEEEETGGSEERGTSGRNFVFEDKLSIFIWINVHFHIMCAVSFEIHVIISWVCCLKIPMLKCDGVWVSSVWQYVDPPCVTVFAAPNVIVSPPTLWRYLEPLPLPQVMVFESEVPETDEFTRVRLARLRCCWYKRRWRTCTISASWYLQTKNIPCRKGLGQADFRHPELGAGRAVV